MTSLAPPHPAASAATAATQHAAFAAVEMHTEADAVAAAWTELEGCAAGSVYQTRGFVLPWMATLGRRAGMRPFFVLARDADGRPTALLLLAVARRGGVRVAQWCGGRDANLPMALLRRPGDWTAAELKRLLRAASRTPGGPDVYDLRNQPAAFAGLPNPMALLPHAPSPSAAHGTALPARSEELFAAKLSKDARKKLRKKEAKLAEMGAVRHVIAATGEERTRIVDAVLALKCRRLRGRGIASDFEAPEMRDFILQAAAAGAIELHALELQPPEGLVPDQARRIVAAYGGGAHAGQWSGMFNAFDPDEAVARTSPGDLLLMRLVAHCCERGLVRFDLGIGEARYKAALCDEAIPLIDVVVPMSPRGHVAAVAVHLQHAVKRRIKRDPRLHTLALKILALSKFTQRHKRLS